MKINNWLILVTSMGLSVLRVVGVLSIKPPTNLTAQEAPSSPNTTASNKLMNNKLVTANTKLSFKLFSEIIKKQPNENIFISPAGAAIALAMTYNGANGETKQSIAQTLELQGMSLQEINQANAVLKETLENPDPSVQLSIANSLWTGKGRPFKTEFIKNMKGFYKAEVQNLNFGDSSSLTIINDWAKQQTKGKIKEIVEPKDIGRDTVFVLVNAIYFLGTWTEPFPKESTIEAPFTKLDGTIKQHPMMFQQMSDVQYYRNDIFKVISLPYGGKRLSMYIFLPHQEVGLKTFYENLNAENWEKWISQVNNYGKKSPDQEIDVGLPRFKLEYSIKLNDTLKALGMDIAFTQSADFSAMTPQPIALSFVKQKTFLDVNEAGTEAAAVTAVGGTRSIHKEVIINRPFFFAIRDNQTGTILFMGSVVDPM
jgi:serine protease inhibitor